MNFKSIVQTVGKTLSHESPTILTGLAVTGFVTTVVLAVRATPKALSLIENERSKYWEGKGNETQEDLDLSVRQTVQVAWKCYIPTFLVGGASIACMIASTSISLRRNAALASLYSLAEMTMRDYQSKVIEVIGKNKEEKVRDALVTDRLSKDPLAGKEVVVTGKGETLFYDSLSGRYFKSDIETIRRIQNDLNKEIVSGTMYISLNNLYDEIGLPHIDLGNQMGWSLDTGSLDIRFTAKISSDGQPCIVVEFKVSPKEF